MNPSPDAITKLQSFAAAQAGGWANADAQLATLANATSTSHPNPVAQRAVIRVFEASAAMAAIGATDLNKILALPAFEPTIRELLDRDPKAADDVRRLNQWAAGLAKAGYLTQSEFDTLAAPTAGTTAGAPAGQFNQTQPDPDYQANLSWALANLGRAADVQDFHTARLAS